MAPPDPSPTYQVRSPIRGTITERRASLGLGVNPGDTSPLFVVADLNTVWVLADVFEQDLALVRKGAQAQITVPAYPDKVFNGTVDRLGDTVDPSSRTVTVRIVLDNRDRLLKPEMYARVTVREPARGAMRVPMSALLTKGDASFVFVEQSPRRFVARQVIVGARDQDSIQILDGIQPGERLVTKGALLLDAEMNQKV